MVLLESGLAKLLVAGWDDAHVLAANGRTRLTQSKSAPLFN